MILDKSQDPYIRRGILIYTRRFIESTVPIMEILNSCLPLPFKHSADTHGKAFPIFSSLDANPDGQKIV